MSSYFTIGMRKQGSGGINKAIDHNLRLLNILKHINNRKNIIIEKQNFKNDQEHIDFCNNNLAKGRRKTKKDVAHAFELVIDCSKEHFKNEKEHLQYLNDAHNFIKNRFDGQLILNSVIHLDEGKPHLHMLISFYNEKSKKWNQKQLMQEKKTDLNELLKDFENKIGKKYGLKKGDYEKSTKSTKTILSSTLELEKHIIKDNKIIVKDYKTLKKELIKAKAAEIELNKIKNKINRTEAKSFLRDETMKDKAKLVHPSTFIIDEKLENNKNKYLISNPLYGDDKPSLGIFRDLNSGEWLYHDFTTSETWDNIAMFMKMNNCNYNNALKELSRENINKNEILTEIEKIKQEIKNEHKKENTTKINIKKIERTDLKEYINKRLNHDEYKYTRTPQELTELEEVTEERTFHYIAIKNAKNGYSCRNKYIKKNINNNSYTNINNNSDKTIVCEGLIDYISLYQTNANSVNYVILNSVNNINSLLKNDILKDTKKIELYLDNDDAGDIATKKIIEKYENKNISDNRHYYKHFKDYNEYYANNNNSNYIADLTAFKDDNLTKYDLLSHHFTKIKNANEELKEQYDQLREQFQKNNYIPKIRYSYKISYFEKVILESINLIIDIHNTITTTTKTNNITNIKTKINNLKSEKEELKKNITLIKDLKKYGIADEDQTETIKTTIQKTKTKKQKNNIRRM